MGCSGHGFLFVLFSSFCRNALFISGHQILRIKKESRRPPRESPIEFPCLVQVPFCPLYASDPAGSSDHSLHECDSPCRSSGSRLAKLSFCFLADAAQAREGPSRETSPREAPASGWAALGLSYKVQWPLHILFTPAVLEK